MNIGLTKNFNKIKYGGGKMKRMIFVLAATLTLVFGISTTAMASITNYVHMDFSTTDNAGCAACHITHAANAKYLLAGPNADGSQKTACYACHGVGKPSPFNVSEGKVAKVDNMGTNNVPTWGAGMYSPSSTGGFDFTYDYADADKDSDTDEYLATTSAHNVEGVSLMNIPAYANQTTDKMPGGNVALGGSFRCGSCHDPHNLDSGSTVGVSGNENPRLLKKTLLAGAVSDHEIEIYYDDAAGGTNKANEYNVNINKWCAGCHDWLNQGDNAGRTAVNVNGTDKYMHAMGVQVTTFVDYVDPKPDFNLNTDYSSGFALGVTAHTGTKDRLICLSCHRVHGSDTVMTGVARSYTDANGYTIGNAGTGAGAGALLRFNDRGVCFQCHGAAAENKEAVGQINQ